MVDSNSHSFSIVTGLAEFSLRTQLRWLTGWMASNDLYKTKRKCVIGIKFNFVKAFPWRNHLISIFENSHKKLSQK